jgi:hypothetical protein
MKQKISTVVNMMSVVAVVIDGQSGDSGVGGELQ